MLAIRCQFLQGTYQAAAPGRLSTPEWPPHPARLQAALVAAAWAQSDGDTVTDMALSALRWLEQLGPPGIAAPPVVGERSSVPVFVPRNLTPREQSDVRAARRAGRDPSRQMGRVDRTFPTMVPGDDAVWFTWADAEPSSEVRDVLGALTQEVHYLGSSRSPVCCDVSDEPPVPTLLPVSPPGEVALRVPRIGLTDALVEGRRSGRAPFLGYLAPYAKTALPSRQDPPLRGPFTDLVLLARTGGFGLTVEHTALLTKALRRAVLAHAGDDAPPILHGHGRHPHAAFLALPSVGHPASSGEIRGLGVAVPEEATSEERATIISATRAVNTLAFHRDVTPWALEPVEMTSLDLRTLDPRAWRLAARRWRSVTPVVLDRHPKRNRGETPEDAIRESFVNALLPEPVEVEVARVPWVPGAVPVAMHGRHGLSTGLALHVSVSFNEPVEGPVLVGRGRYFGLGLLRPSPDRGDG